MAQRLFFMQMYVYFITFYARKFIFPYKRVRTFPSMMFFTFVCFQLRAHARFAMLQVADLTV